MTDQNTEPDVQQTDTAEVVNSLPPAEPEGVSTDTDTPEVPDDAEDTIVYKRADLEKLRQENGKYRQRAQRADDLAQRLHTELVRATGKLADPTDLPFSEEHLFADADTMAAAINELLAKKPHLAARRPIGEIGQGVSPSGGTVDLAAILRGQR